MKNRILLLILISGLLVLGCAAGSESESQETEVSTTTTVFVVICYSDGSYSIDVETTKTPVGIAVSSDIDGHPTKIMNLTESSQGLKWCSYEADAYNMDLSTSTKDGSNNYDILKKAVSDENITGHYPAFEYVNNLNVYGESWYIPAQDELNTIYNYKSEINDAVKRLLKAGFFVNPLSSTYWSSTTEDNKAIGQYFGSTTKYFVSGESYNSSRTNNLYVRAIREFSSSSVFPALSTTTTTIKSIADYICYSDGSYSNRVLIDKTPVGIAIEADDNGRPTKILHLNEDSGSKWCNKNANACDKIIYTSHDDGSDNWNIICEAVSDENLIGYYPAFQYVNKLNEYNGEWYIPAEMELDAIYELKYDINTTLNLLFFADFHVTFLGENVYWSSSTYNWSDNVSSEAWYMNFDGSYVTQMSLDKMWQSHYVRAVCLF